MRKVLGAAGIAEDTLRLIKDVTANCKQCREWATSGEDKKASLDVPTKINEAVEIDLLFYKQHIVFHAIDRASRYHNGIEINGKTKADILDGFHKSWLSFMHAPVKLYVDGEAAI